jgi:hypothetical protein
MNEYSEQSICEPELREEVEIPDQDDRYPGSFFRIPGIPVPGQTAWSIT